MIYKHSLFFAQFLYDGVEPLRKNDKHHCHHCGAWAEYVWFVKNPKMHDVKRKYYLCESCLRKANRVHDLAGELDELIRERL